MRPKAVIAALLAVAVTAVLCSLAPAALAEESSDCPDNQTCEFPSPQECETTDSNGYWDGGGGGRGAVCVSQGGQLIFYAGGNATERCGVIMVFDERIYNSGAGSDTPESEDPNSCP